MNTDIDILRFEVEKYLCYSAEKVNLMDDAEVRFIHGSCADIIHQDKDEEYLDKLRRIKDNETL